MSSKSELDHKDPLVWKRENYSRILADLGYLDTPQNIIILDEFTRDIVSNAQIGDFFDRLLENRLKKSA